MTWYPRALVLIGSASLLVACGGRSQLRDVGASSSAGGGGSGPGTSTASDSSASSGGEGGFGGQGGSPPNGCVLDGPPIGVAGTDGYALTNPVLLAPGKSDLTTLVAGWTTTAEGPTMPPSEVRHTSFHAWGAWPANGTIAPSYLASYDGGQSFVAAPAASGFSVFLALPPPSSEIDFMTPFTPGSGAAAGTGAALPLAAEPAFLVQGDDPDIHFLGFSGFKQGIHDFSVVRLSDTMGSENFSPVLGCAVDPIVADAAPLGGGFVFAFSGGSKVLDPGCATGTGIASGQHLFVVPFDTSGGFLPTADVVGADSDGPIDVVKVAPRADGAWVVWRHHKSAGLQIMRLDTKGEVASPTFEIPFFGDPASVSATALGDRLAVAWTSPHGDAPSELRASVISAPGNVDADVDLPLDPATAGRTAILASPSSKSLLVAWAEGGPSGSRVRIARLACTLP